MSRRAHIRKALLAKFLSKAAERLDTLHHALAQFEEAQVSDEALDAAMREIHTLKGESRLMGFVLASTVCHRVEDLMEHARDAGFKPDARVYRAAVQGLDLVAEMLQDDPPRQEPDEPSAGFLTLAASLLGREETAPSAAGDAPEPEPPPSSKGSARATSREDLAPTAEPTSSKPTGFVRAASPTVARVPTEQLERLSHLATDLLLLHHRQEHAHQTLQALRGELSSLGAKPGDPAAVDGATPANPRQRLASLMSNWGELLFEARNNLKTLNDSIHQLRLVPLSNLLDRYPGAIRAMARSQGKEVKVVLAGGHISVDQQLVDEISDSIVHIIRNAVDHGIESPTERRAAGKPERACIELSAQESGGVLTLDVRDDGRGVDPTSVADAAVARGLCTSDEARNLDMAGALRMILRPGFTTNLRVTDVSGRGVGMDAVVTTAERLGGSVQIDSELGGGTSIRLSVPARVAVVEALVVDVGNAWYAIPSMAVHRVVLAEPGQFVRAGQSWALKDDGLLVPVVGLAAIVGTSAPASLADGREAVIILSHGERLLGLRDHTLIGSRTAVRRQLDPFVSGLHLINGTSVLETGELIYLLNVPELFRIARDTELTTQRAKPDEQVRHKRVLVVDDSELTRDMLVALTRNLGLEVIEAVNGKDAIERLSREPVDLVLTDLDMPIMDGFTLIERLRAGEDTRTLPIVVLSTRGAVEDKERAMHAGADSYLVKSQFDESEFASMLRVYVDS